MGGGGGGGDREISLYIHMQSPPGHFHPPPLSTSYTGSSTLPSSSLFLHPHFPSYISPPPVNSSTDCDGCPLLLVGLGQCPDLGHGGHLTLCDRDLHVLTEHLHHQRGRQTLLLLLWLLSPFHDVMCLCSTAGTPYAICELATII